MFLPSTGAIADGLATGMREALLPNPHAEGFLHHKRLILRQV
jgi:hypothetical protein